MCIIYRKHNLHLYTFEIPVDHVKYNQDHQNWYEWVAPEELYNHVKFERVPFHYKQVPKKIPMLTVMVNFWIIRKHK